MVVVTLADTLYAVVLVRSTPAVYECARIMLATRVSLANSTSICAVKSRGHCGGTGDAVTVVLAANVMGADSTGSISPSSNCSKTRDAGAAAVDDGRSDRINAAYP